MGSAKTHFKTMSNLISSNLLWMNNVISFYGGTFQSRHLTKPVMTVIYLAVTVCLLALVYDPRTCTDDFLKESLYGHHLNPIKYGII